MECIIKNTKSIPIITNKPKSPQSGTSTPYGLDRCQIDTPGEIVNGFWQLVKRHRKEIGDVVDLGAGDGRFSAGAAYKKYEGYEIDKQRILNHRLPLNATIINKCAFEAKRIDYDVCIGNPPYVRHHNIEDEWREEIVERIEKELGFSVNRMCNLYVYFIGLGLLKTKPDGLVALLVPYEWVSRPSTKPLRKFIESKNWDVHVYRFRNEVFKGVLTTASISIIDKAASSGAWKFYDIDCGFNISPRKQMSGSKYGVLKYEKRSAIWALRGLSPGSQKIFTLSEGERLHLGVKRSDVDACATSLRDIPKSLKKLTRAGFRKYFIETGKKCWLIRSFNRPPSQSLKKYLDSVPQEERNTTTCTDRRLWYAYKPHPVPKLLYSSGFTSFGPKILVNDVGAMAVGSVHGIHSSNGFSAEKVRGQLISIDFEKRIVPHAGSLKKIEVGQMNGILRTYFSRVGRNGSLCQHRESQVVRR